MTGSPTDAARKATRPTGQERHLSVMLTEVLAALAPRDGGIYLDGTFGAGGYSRGLLEAADCRVWGIDRDPAAIAGGQALLRHFAGRLDLVEGRYSEMERLLPQDLHRQIDGIALDLGVSSMQIDQAERGFSFRGDGPLDMRMEGPEAGSDRPSAAEVVMSLGEEELADILFRYGEERRARQVARAIVAARRERPIARTGELAAIVRAVIRTPKGSRGKSGGKAAIDPSTRTFQALRIYVNDELGELERGLEAAERMLAPGGRLAVVSFHSLEDRLTKAFLKTRSEDSTGVSRHSPASVSPCRLAGEGHEPAFTLLFRGAQKPGDAETKVNPRARSARLRAARRRGPSEITPENQHENSGVRS